MNNALAVQFCEQNPQLADQLSVGFSSFIPGMESLERSKEKELSDRFNYFYTVLKVTTK